MTENSFKKFCDGRDKIAAANRIIEHIAVSLENVGLTKLSEQLFYL
jgi:hypothetical protein